MLKQSMWKRILGLALAGTLLLAPCALAAEGGDEPRIQMPAPWAVEELADSYALGLVDDNFPAYIEDPVTEDALIALCGAVAEKLVLLGRPDAEVPELEVDGTRGGVMNAMYMVAGGWDFGVEGDDALSYLRGLGVVKGNESGDPMTERVCSYQEAMVMAQRLVLALYDRFDAGAKGLLWKAGDGDTTLYLLGTIHADRDNVYPFHKTLRDAILSAEKTYMELNLNDAAGLMELAAMQTYSDGTTLADHVTAELYGRTVALFAQLGVPEEQIVLYKPWALAQTISNLVMQDESTGTVMAVDMYVNAKSVNHGTPVAGLETYAFQGGIFDGTSAEYQLESLEQSVTLMEGVLTGELDEETAAALEEELTMMSGMMAAWKAGDPAAMAEIYDKAAILDSDDEMLRELFARRDPNMVQAARAILDEDGGHTYLMAVGAGHMMEPGGIVPELEKLGYTVEFVY